MGMNSRDLNEICRVFMADDGQFPGVHVARLRTALRGFLATIEEALHSNRSLVESEQQRSFHDELVQGYLELKALVDLYLGPAAPVEEPAPPAAGNSSPATSRLVS